MDNSLNIFCHILISITLYAVSLMSHGENIYIPASFPDNDNSLQNKIEFPDIDEDIVFGIICDAEVSKFGKVNFNVCFSDNDKHSALFERPIHRAIKSVRLVPATVNGRNVRVWFQYTVEYVKYGEKKVVNVYPNHGYEVEKFGRKYTSAQWYSEPLEVSFRGCGPMTNLWVKAIISKEGIPTAPEIIGGKANDRCRNNLMAIFMARKFIPVIHEGQPVASIYAESFFTPGSIKFR